jgi:hypothetical protein
LYGFGQSGDVEAEFVARVDRQPVVLRQLDGDLPGEPGAESATFVDVRELDQFSLGCLVRVFTSIVDTVPLPLLATTTVLPSGVTASPNGNEPTAISVGFLVLIFTSIVDTEALPALVTKPAGRHGARAATADTRARRTPTSTLASPTTTTPRTHRNRRIAAPRFAVPRASVGSTTPGYVALGFTNKKNGHQPSGATSCALIDAARWGLRSQLRLAARVTGAADDVARGRAIRHRKTVSLGTEKLVHRAHPEPKHCEQNGTAMGLWRRRTHTPKRPHSVGMHSSSPRRMARRYWSELCSPEPQVVGTRQWPRPIAAVLPAVREERQCAVESVPARSRGALLQTVKARVHIWRLALFALLGFIGLAVTAGWAFAGSPVTFANTPPFGPPGGSITVSSITPCPPLPPGVEGPPIVLVMLVQGEVDARGIGSVELPVNASGTWSGTLVVGASASQGDATLGAFCYSRAETAGPILEYEPRRFSVTALAAPLSPLPLAAAPRLTG